jgi:hypothetical protein
VTAGFANQDPARISGIERFAADPALGRIICAKTYAQGTPIEIISAL